MKGLSNAVVMIILLIASVITAIVVVGLTYGLFGTVTYNSVITSVGNAYIKYNPSSGGLEIFLTVVNSGPEVPTVVSVSIGNSPVSVTSITDVNGGTTVSGSNVSLQPGTNYLTVTGYVQTQLQPGSTAYVHLTLSNGVVLVVSAIVGA